MGPDLGVAGGQIDKGATELALLWVLNLSDGDHSLLDIAERAELPFPAVRRVRLLETDHVGTKLRQLQPKRHLPFEHAAFACGSGRTYAFAGDDQHEAGSLTL